MVSSNNGPDAEEMFKSVRRFGKDFLEDLYIEVEKDGNFLLPEEAVAAFFRFLRGQPGQPGLTIGLTDSEEDRLGRKLYRKLCDDAAVAYIRHKPGLEIKKGKPAAKKSPSVHWQSILILIGILSLVLLVVLCAIFYGKRSKQ